MNKVTKLTIDEPNVNGLSKTRKRVGEGKRERKKDRKKKTATKKPLTEKALQEESKQVYMIEFMQKKKKKYKNIRK